MDKSLVTETADVLAEKAEKDIITIKALLAKKFYPEDLMYDIMSFHATMAVEKLLKSYIISNGRDIEKTHNIEYLRKAAMKIDNSFEKIEDDCVLLNKFTPNLRYDDEKQITKQDMDNIIKSLNNVCDFQPIKAMRDLLNKEKKYEIID